MCDPLGISGFDSIMILWGSDLIHKLNKFLVNMDSDSVKKGVTDFSPVISLTKAGSCR